MHCYDLINYWILTGGRKDKMRCAEHCAVKITQFIP